MKLGIVIVNWNSGSRLAAAVNSIAKYVTDFPCEIVIVDNASTDNSLTQANLSSFPSSIKVKTILNEVNKGFGVACNQGAWSCSGQYILFLNPDAALLESLQPLIDFMDDASNKEIGICGISLVDEVGDRQRSCSRFHSPGKSVFKSLGISRIFPELGSPMLDWDHAESRYVDQVIGAFYFVRRDLFEELGGFDEDFFVYYEELDFSLRARRNYRKSFYFASIKAFHEGGGTTSQVKAMRLFYSLRSELIFLKKHFGVFRTVLPLLSMIFIQPLTRSILAASRFSILECKELFHAYILLYVWLFQRLRH